MPKGFPKATNFNEAGFGIIEALVALVIFGFFTMVAINAIGDSTRQKAQIVASSAGIAPASLLLDKLTEEANKILVTPMSANSIKTNLQNVAWKNSITFTAGQLNFKRSLPGGLTTAPCLDALGRESCISVKDALARCTTKASSVTTTPTSPSSQPSEFHTCFFGEVVDPAYATYFSKTAGKKTSNSDILFAELSLYFWDFETNSKTTPAIFYSATTSTGVLSVLTLYWTQASKAFHQTVARQFPYIK